ncbi:TCP-1/cpn60 chaperonin family protein [archaeon]|nr:TCP-1/cpn60 chaperonin family protein [archaeon]
MTNNNSITSDNTERYLGKEAQRNNILAARVLAETVKTTLGPMGMDKMLVDSAGNITVTNDGVTILSEMEIEHPAAKMIVEIAKTQESEVGDGTTTAVMLAGKLLENAEKLLDQKIHPTIITKGYKLAAEKSKQILSELAAEISTEEELGKIAQTAMTGKGAEYVKEKFDSIIINAIKTISVDGKVNLDDIKIEKQKGESIEKTELIYGIVLDKERVSLEMPKVVENAKIALLECALEVKSLERETRISISSPDQFQSFINQEENLLKSMVAKMEEIGANVIICQRGIDESVQFDLAKKGIYAIRRIAKTDMEKLAKATNGKIVANVKELTVEDLGFAKKVEEIKENENGMTYITGCENPKAVTILIRGGTEHVIDEIERAIMDALGDVSAVLKDSKVVAGGGAVEIELARRLREYSQTLKGREQLAVQEFASAMEFIPITLAENAGLDPLDILTELKVNHESGNKNHGLNLFNGRIEDTMHAGIIEPLRIKTQAITSASEVSMMILRIDDIIASGKLKTRKHGTNEMEDYD